MEKIAFLAVIFSLWLVATVSAEPFISMHVRTNLTQDHDGRLSLGNGGDVDLTDVTLTSIANFPVYFSLNHFDMPVPDKGTGYAVSPRVFLDSVDDLTFGYNPIKIEARSNEGAYNSVDMNVERSFCENGPTEGKLSIKSIDINSDGDRDETWIPLDRVTVDVEIENNGKNDFRDVVIEMSLFDSSGRNVVKELFFDNSGEEKIEIGRIRDGDDESGTFSFKVPGDFQIGDYKLAIKTYDRDVGENIECDDDSPDLTSDFFEPITVEYQQDQGKMVVIDDIELNPSEFTCGQKGTATFVIYNIGDENQDKVKVKMNNPDLLINQEEEVSQDLDSGDQYYMRMDFQIPENTEKGIYKIAFKTYYDYRGGGVYGEESEETWYAYVNVTGCQSSLDKATVFVTSFKINNPNLLQDPNADNYCQIAADNAGLKGTFVAWLSGSRLNARERVVDAEYVRTDGQTVAYNLHDLLDGTLSRKINIDEYGDKLDKGLVFTGTKGEGTVWGTNTCHDWHGLTPRSSRNFALGYGNINGWDKTWTQDGITSCDDAYRNGAHLYCFQVE